MRTFNVFDPTYSMRGKFFLEASAGTGKTFTIEQLILRGLLEGNIQHVEQVLAVTFTNAATNELKLRIQTTLCEAKNMLKEALTNSNVVLPSYLSKSCNVKRLYTKLRGALAAIDRMAIFTLHGFCNHLLQKIFPTIQITQEHTPLTHSQTVLKYILEYLRKEHWRSVLFPEQFQRLSAYYASQTHLVDILLKSYPNQAQLLYSKEKIFDKLVSWHQSLPLQTIPQNVFLEELFAALHGFAKVSKTTLRDIESFVTHLYQPTSPKLLTYFRVAEAFASAKQLKRFKPYRALSLLEQTSWREDILTFCHIPTIMNTLLYGLREYLKQAYTWWLSPDESIHALEALLPTLSSETIQAIREQFQLVVIDEFQDTDRLQWEIFSRLFLSEAYTGSLFLIGDPKQSIYEWRNADLPTYLKAKAQFPKEAQLHLINNYRSEPRLMHGLNLLFSQLSPFLKIPGYDSIAYNPLIPQTQETLIHSHAPIHFFAYHNVIDQAAWISQTAIKLHSEQGIPLGKMVILVIDSAQAFDLITHSSLPLAFSKTKSIFSFTETYQLTALLLDALLYPDHYQKVQRVLLSSLFGLSFQESYEQREQFSSLFFGWNHYLHQNGLLATFYHLMRTQGEALLSTPQGDLIFQEMEILCAHLDTVTPHPYHQLLFLHHFSQTERQEKTLSLSSCSEDLDTLKITTVHASKGLEYDVVFCPALSKSKRNKHPSESIRETYVACTRAKKQLYIPVPITPSAHYDSALTKYLQAINSPLSPLSFAQNLSENHPVYFSFSTKQAISQPLPPPKIEPPKIFELIPPKGKEILSFSSTREEWEGEPIAETSHLFPGGKKTGLIIHKILAHLTAKFHSNLEDIKKVVCSFVRHSELEPAAEYIAERLHTLFKTPLPFPSGNIILKELSPQCVFTEEPFLFSQEEELWQGIVDLFFEHRGHYYLIDWKSSFLGDSFENYTADKLTVFLQQQGLDRQGILYRRAAQLFLQQFDIESMVEVGFVFIRGIGPNSGFVALPND